MICLVCHALTPGRLCPACSRGLRPVPERILPGGLRVVAAYRHEGVARGMVHLLKYKGVSEYAQHVAGVVADRVPRLPLVPVPRAVTRRLRYAVDPSRLLATELAGILRVPVIPALRPRFHAPRRAGHNRDRPATGFVSRRPIPFPVILVDDVVTTGATLLAAARALGPERVELAVVANASPVSSLSVRDPA